VKRFSFRLQTLLDMKQNREKELARKVAEKNGEINRATVALHEDRGSLAKFQDEEKRQRSAPLSALLLRLSVVHRHTLQQAIEDKGRRIIGLRQELRLAMGSLTEAKKETRALEILRDEKQAQWKREYARKEQKFTDDVSQKGHIRASRAADRSYDR
jgi:flagellar protein FliJ